MKRREYCPGDRPFWWKILSERLVWKTILSALFCNLNKYRVWTLSWPFITFQALKCRHTVRNGLDFGNMKDDFGGKLILLLYKYTRIFSNVLNEIYEITIYDNAHITSSSCLNIVASITFVENFRSRHFEINILKLAYITNGFYYFKVKEHTNSYELLSMY